VSAVSRLTLGAVCALLLACEPTSHVVGADAQTLAGVASPVEAEWEVIEARPRTWEKDVQPILLEHCGPCHVGPAEQACVGGTCLSLFYDAFASYWTCCTAPYIVFTEKPDSCESNALPIPVWQCGMNRIYSFVSQGKDPVPDEQVKVLEEWIEDGMLLK
jgi:hypothetical protein